VISAMVLIQLAFPGAPVTHAIFTSLMHPRTGGYISEVPTPSYTMSKQLAHAWNVPCLGGGRVSGDAPVLGWQSGYEVGLGAALSVISGAEVCGIMGLVGSATTLYPEEIILDHDILHYVFERLNNKGFDGIDEALDLIKTVGPRNHYLREKHTRDNIRNFRVSPLFMQRAEDGSIRNPREVALEKFKEIEVNHNPQPLPDEVLLELDKIIKSAEQDAEKIFRK
jgi:trimethylamine:corrinoid methyltransferase-like protein